MSMRLSLCLTGYTNECFGVKQKQVFHVLKNNHVLKVLDDIIYYYSSKPCNILQSSC